MNSLKTSLFTVFSFMLFFSCGQERGQLNIALDTSGLSNVASIERFIFIAEETDLSTRVLFPGECFSCLDGGTNCDATQRCIDLQNCGLSASASPIEIDISFNNIPSGDTFNLTVCALGSGTSVLASGETALVNQNGASATLVMDNSSSVCDSQFPVVCSE